VCGEMKEGVFSQKRVLFLMIVLVQFLYLTASFQIGSFF
jgi:hypothetical protein